MITIITIFVFMKKCIKCKLDKPVSSFSRTGKGSKRKATCNACIRVNKKSNDPDYDLKKNLKKKYNITIEDYNYMMESQNSTCAICKTHKLDLKRGLYVDHCHKSLKVRGLLCNNCNTILGMAKDNTDILYNCIKYLQK